MNNDKRYNTKYIINSGYNLEPLECIYCNSLEVTFNQYIGDASCANCGEWQTE